MILDFSVIDSADISHHLKQTAVPRPIAWVLSENDNGSLNLAPFSYFSVVCENPPLLMLAMGKKADGTFKDTRVNLEFRSDFVVHIPSQDMVAAVNESSASLAYGESEVEKLGLELETFPGCRLPRIKGAHIAYACTYHDAHEVEFVPQILMLGLVHRLYIDEAICSRDELGRPRVEADKLKPLMRLGNMEYATLGEVIKLPSPE